jgi:hypothetical protein
MCLNCFEIWTTNNSSKRNNPNRTRSSRKGLKIMFDNRTNLGVECGQTVPLVRTATIRRFGVGASNLLPNPYRSYRRAGFFLPIKPSSNGQPALTLRCGAKTRRAYLSDPLKDLVTIGEKPVSTSLFHAPASRLRLPNDGGVPKVKSKLRTIPSLWNGCKAVERVLTDLLCTEPVLGIAVKHSCECDSMRMRENTSLRQSEPPQ